MPTSNVDISDLPIPDSSTDISDLPAPPTISSNLAQQQNAALPGMVQGFTSGANAGAMDILGAPMDFATNSANLLKAGAEEAYLKLGKLPPTWLDPSDPSTVPGTSEWLKAKSRNYLGANTVDATSSDAGARASHLAGELLGPLPFAAGVSGLRTLGREPVTINGQTSEVENPQSISAAAASPQVNSASPELQEAVQNAQKMQMAGNGRVNAEALNRHLEAESLPVPIQLTEGQAKQDPVLLSGEMNARGKLPELAKRFADQNKGLVENLQALRDEVGPDVFSTNPVEHGETLINAYKAKAAAADADIDAKYQALRNAAGGKFPIDAIQLDDNVTQALHDKLLYEHAPSAEMAQLSKASKSGNMTFEQFEALRTNLATIARTSSDGLERRAAGVIRDQMEQLPLSGEAANLKPLADSARAAARAQFQALDADPAYKAAVNGSVPPDRFAQKFLIGAPKEDVITMRRNLSNDPAATQTMGVSVLDHLRRTAGVDEFGNGNFSQANYNKNLSALRPKLGALVDPKTQETLENLGNVARYTQFQPRGSFVNNSNTTVSAKAVEFGKGLAEQAVNAKTFGIGGTLMRKHLEGKAAKAYADRVLAPGAGILDPVPNP